MMFPPLASGGLGHADAEADCCEMERLLAACARPRVQAELEPWLASAQQRRAMCKTPLAELQADQAEMEALLEECNLPTVKLRLQPWLDAVKHFMDGTYGAVASAAAGSDFDCAGAERAQVTAPLICDRLPTVLIIGDRGTGKRRLLQALADVRPGEPKHDAQQCAFEATIETKYFVARICYRILDIDAGLMTDTQLPSRSADAVVVLWDVARPDTWQHAAHALSAMGLVADDDVGDEDAERPELVQMCVAVEGPHTESAEPLEMPPQADENEERARIWCAEHGFEHLRCRFSGPELEKVRTRLKKANKGCFASILSDDTDGTASRILEALESNPWRGLQRRQHGVEAPSMASAHVAEPDTPPLEGSEVDLPPLIAVVGAVGVGQQKLVCALSGTQMPEPSTAGTVPFVEAVLDTKYYTAKLRLCAVDAGVLVDPFSPNDPSAVVRMAHAVILLWDTTRPDTLSSVCALFAANGDANPGLETPGNTHVRLLVGVDGQASDACSKRVEHNQESTIQSWCAQHGFECLCCAMNTEDLKILSTNWCSGGRGVSLLAPENQGGAARIVEALQCCLWPGLDMKKNIGAASIEGQGESGNKNMESPKPNRVMQQFGETTELNDGPSSGSIAPSEGAKQDVLHQKCSSASNDASVESMEHLAEEMRAVRAIGDDAQRRERACDVALKLAQSLGIDSDSEGEEFEP